MAILLNVTTTPQSFAAGTFDTAAAAMNDGVSRFTFTPTDPSTSYAGGNFHLLFSQPHGGIWLNDVNLELYDSPGDNLAFTRALTWGAGEPVTVTIDSRSGSRQVTVSGATTGNGTFTFSVPGPYYNIVDTLDSGRFTGGGATFDFVGTISSIDNTVTTDTVSPAAISIVGGAVQARRGLKAGAVAAAIALSGGAIIEGQSGESDSVTAAEIDIVSGDIATKRTYAVSVIPSSIAVTGGTVADSQGGLISLGPTALDFQLFSFADRPSSVTMNTPESGAVVLLCAGGNSTDLSTSWTDNKNAASPVTVGTLVEYPDFAGYGTIVAITPAPMTGGTAHTFTQQVGAGDENTTFALTAVVAGGHPRVTEAHNNVNNASGTTQQTSPSLTIDGEALLVAYWWGSSPVVGPFPPPPPGVGTPFTAIPDGGFTVAESYLVNNEFGEIQGAMAYLYVPAGGGPSTHDVTWTHSPAQGAQVRLVAIQPALAESVLPAAISIASGSIGERRSIKVSAASASLALAGGSIDEGTQTADVVSPATVSITGSTVQVRRTILTSITPAALALVGGDVQDQSNDLQDSVSPAIIEIQGGVLSSKRTHVSTVASASLSVVGTVVSAQRTWADGATPAVFLIVAGPVSAIVSRKASTQPAALSLSGQDVQDQVTTGAQDSVSPATLSLLGATVLVRMSRSGVVQPALVVLGGGTVETQISSMTPSVTPIPPGRSPDQLVGRVEVPSIESRASEQSHLFGVVRSKKDV